MIVSPLFKMVSPPHKVGYDPSYSMNSNLFFFPLKVSVGNSDSNLANNSSGTVITPLFSWHTTSTHSSKLKILGF